MTGGTVAARWWVVIGLLLWILADVAGLEHAGQGAHAVYTFLGWCAFVVAAVNALWDEETR